MTIYEFATMLDGRTRGNEISNKEAIMAQELGFIIVFGASDDLMEIRGSIDDEVGAFDGTSVFLNRFGIVEECSESCSHYQAACENALKLTAIWCGEERYRWTYEIEDIEHANFHIVQDEEPYCRGVVFRMEDLK